jgi:hypothetical protein
MPARPQSHQAPSLGIPFRIRPWAGLAAIVLAAITVIPAAGAERTLVVCAPGYPGNTLQAQATMDAFARAAVSAAGWPPASLAAVYDETLQGGKQKLGAADAVLAIVTLPFLLQEGNGLRLKPRLQVVQESGASETWSLVAKRGALASAGALDGWEVAGGAGYAPDFVRSVLAGWGTLPPTAKILFAPAALTGLRRAAAGEKVAMLLDGAAVAALPTLPFASDLEIVTRSPKVPGSLLCTVGDRLPERDVEAMLKGLSRLGHSPAGAEVLKTMRMTRFEPVDRPALEAARAAFDRAAGAGH